jgi:hypothetical protein
MLVGKRVHRLDALRGIGIRLLGVALLVADESLLGIEATLDKFGD